MFTTTTTTTTLDPPIDPSSFFNFHTSQQEPFSIPSTEDPFKHFKNYFTSTTTKPPMTRSRKQFEFGFFTNKQKATSATISPIKSQQFTSSISPTNNPFYYGIDFKKITPTYNAFTTQNPFAFKEFEFNYMQTTSTTVSTPFAFSFPSTTTTTTQSTPSKSASLAITSPPDHTELSLPPSTRNPVFDVYLKRIASTTKNPYDFANFANYYKSTTSTSTPFSYNFLDMNSNTAAAAAFSEILQRKQTISHS